eukprot:352478-Chlamydomonas_euryale.AAC.1
MSHLALVPLAQRGAAVRRLAVGTLCVQPRDCQLLVRHLQLVLQLARRLLSCQHAPLCLFRPGTQPVRVRLHCCRLARRRRLHCIARRRQRLGVRAGGLGARCQRVTLRLERLDARHRSQAHVAETAALRLAGVYLVVQRHHGGVARSDFGAQRGGRRRRVCERSGDVFGLGTRRCQLSVARFHQDGHLRLRLLTCRVPHAGEPLALHFYLAHQLALAAQRL